MDLVTTKSQKLLRDCYFALNNSHKSPEIALRINQNATTYRVVLSYNHMQPSTLLLWQDNKAP